MKFVSRKFFSKALLSESLLEKVENIMLVSCKVLIGESSLVTAYQHNDAFQVSSTWRGESIAGIDVPLFSLETSAKKSSNYELKKLYS